MIESSVVVSLYPPKKAKIKNKSKIMAMLRAEFPGRTRAELRRALRVRIKQLEKQAKNDRNRIP
jgi:hypothetical protein